MTIAKYWAFVLQTDGVPVGCCDGGRTKPRRSEGVMTMAARSLAKMRLHVVAAHWHALKVVVYSNRLVYPPDCALNQCGSWLRVVETL
jgi:hypothetical protein